LPFQPLSELKKSRRTQLRRPAILSISCRSSARFCDYDAVLSRAVQRMAALDSLNHDTDRKEAIDEY
jgi:hypothetical protein